MRCTVSPIPYAVWNAGGCRREGGVEPLLPAAWAWSGVADPEIGGRLPVAAGYHGDAHGLSPPVPTPPVSLAVAAVTAAVVLVRVGEAVAVLSGAVSVPAVVLLGVVLVGDAVVPAIVVGLDADGRTLHVRRLGNRGRGGAPGAENGSIGDLRFD